jgi:hypothetical protein
LSFYEGVGVGVGLLKMEESESEVLNIDEQESESELLCTDSTALQIRKKFDINKAVTKSTQLALTILYGGEYQRNVSEIITDNHFRRITKDH